MPALDDARPWPPGGRGPDAVARRQIVGYHRSMAKGQDKKRSAKTNKPKLTTKEKKAKKLEKKKRK